MKNREIASGLKLTYLTQLVTLLSGLVYTPLMLRIIGQSEYGLYQLSSSVISYLGLLNFGFSSGYLRLYFRFRAANDDAGIRRLNGLYVVLFSAVSALGVIIGFVCIIELDEMFSAHLTSSEIADMRILLVIMLASLVLTFMSSVFDCYISAFNRFTFQRGLQLIKSICNPFISLPVILLGYGPVG